jgi:hypothetical protein
MTKKSFSPMFAFSLNYRFLMSTRSIFLLGEGDFSFTHSLSHIQDNHPLFPNSFDSIIASSLDSRREVVEKYPHFANMHFGPLVSVYHSVNALDVSSWPPTVTPHHTLLWNHPHCGHEDANEHFQLLCHFFHTIPHNQSCAIISLIEGQYERWRVDEASRKSGWFLQQPPLPFETKAFPGYQARRNLSGTSFKNNPAPSQTWSSFFYVFGRQMREVGVTTEERKNEKKLSFKCGSCEKSFASFQGMKTHIRQVHELGKYNDSEIRECEICGEKFRGPEALYNHRIGVHAFREKLKIVESVKRVRFAEYLCEICGSTDPDHVVKFGRNNDLETCGQCGRKFSDKRALFQHISHIHHS